MISSDQLKPGQLIYVETWGICQFEQMEGPYLRWKQGRELGYKGPGRYLTGLAYLNEVRLPTSLEKELL